MDNSERAREVITLLDNDDPVTAFKKIRELHRIVVPSGHFSSPSLGMEAAMSYIKAIMKGTGDIERYRSLAKHSLEFFIDGS